MQGKIIRIERVTYDAKRGSFDAQITLAAQSGPMKRRLQVPGHRSWSGSQIIAAIKLGAASGRASLTRH
ncbi:MAG: hypothetical protein AAF841_09210 [Pseudomonadota bacterium]